MFPPQVRSFGCRIDDREELIDGVIEEFSIGFRKEDSEASAGDSANETGRIGGGEGKDSQELALNGELIGGGGVSIECGEEVREGGKEGEDEKMLLGLFGDGGKFGEVESRKRDGFVG